MFEPRLAGIEEIRVTKSRMRVAAAGVSVLMATTGLVAISGQAGASTTGVSAKSITVGGLIEATSASGYSEKTAVTGAEAYFKQVNSSGGINGRKVDYIGYKTDAGTPNKDLTAAKQLVQESHVFAVLPVATTGLAAGGTYLVKAGVPFFGWGVEPSFCNNTVGFGFSGCLVPSTKSDKVSTTAGGLVAAYLKNHGGFKKGTTVALIGADNTAGSFGITVSKASFVAEGFDVTYSKASIPGTGTTNYAPYVATIMKSATGKPPAIMYYVTEVPETIGMSNAMKAAGYTGLQLDPTSYTPEIVTTPSTDAAMQGHLSWIQWSPTSAGTPADKTELKAIEQQTGKKISLVDEQYSIGYLSAALFTAIAKRAGKNLTHASFIKAANAKKWTFGITGLMGTVTWPTDHKDAGTCGALLLISGKTFKPEVPLTCYGNTPLSTATT
jgi:branched-chain amino acid transport system substrate-binding protein